MAWEPIMCTMVRHLINDVDASAFSDSRINTSIAIAAFLVQQDINISTYTVNVNAPSITPDPTDSSTLNNSFTNLVVLRTAWFLFDNLYKEAGSQSFSIKDGPSSIDVTDRTKAYKDLASTYEKMYGRAKIEYLSGSNDAGKAILSPFTQEGIAPRKFI